MNQIKHVYRYKCHTQEYNPHLRLCSARHMYPEMSHGVALPAKNTVHLS